MGLLPHGLLHLVLTAPGLPLLPHTSSGQTRSSWFAASEQVLLGDDAIVQLVQRDIVLLHARWKPLGDHPHPLPRSDRARKVADRRLYLAVVEDHRWTLVAEQRTFPRWAIANERLARHVD